MSPSSPYRTYGQVRSAPTVTPQSRPIPGREAEMTANNTGGYGFILSDMERLNRFLIMGSDGGTYYVGEQTLTKQNAEVVLQLIKNGDGPKVVAAARAVNVQNRAPKVDPQLFVLALCIMHGDDKTAAAVHEAAPHMLRTGSHLLKLVSYIDVLSPNGNSGWGRGKRRLIADWFETEDVDRLAFQVLKYRNRDGWTMYDAMKMAHPNPPTPQHVELFHWIAGKQVHHPMYLPEVITDYTRMMCLTHLPVYLQAQAGIAHGLPRECLPTEALKSINVWRQMLPSMPMHAMLRNLGTMTALGVFDSVYHVDRNHRLAIDHADKNHLLAIDHVVRQLHNEEILHRQHVHPFAILLTSMVYRQGHGVRSDKTWRPNNEILSALEDAYDLAFHPAAATGKRILIGIDVSASMSQNCIGTPIPASMAAAAMALTLARQEPKADVVRFDTLVRDYVKMTKRTGIMSLHSTVGGGTNLAAPVEWALQRARDGLRYWGTYDVFVILTDNETWAGSRHPVEALQTFRKLFNPAAKLVCCSMAANHASVVDPTDPLSFGCAGLDANLPQLVSDFIGKA